MLEAKGSPNACSDDANNQRNEHWQSTYRWRYRASSTPDEIGSGETRMAIERAFANITGAHNDCGLTDRVSAQAEFQGNTDRAPDISGAGSCLVPDDQNTIGFGRLSFGIAGVTCWWFIGDRIVESDMRLNSRLDWATKLGDCDDALMVEAVATHEAGHVFGLRHVGEAKHGRLTMSTHIDGTCENAESSLGLGDVLSLQVNY